MENENSLHNLKQFKKKTYLIHKTWSDILSVIIIIVFKSMWWIDDAAWIANFRFPLKSMAAKMFPALPAHEQPSILGIW